MTTKPKLKRTKDVLSRDELADYVDCDGLDLKDVERVCDGEWRRQKNDKWRFWKNRERFE